MKINLLESSLNLIFPPECGLCKKISKSYLCKECANKLKQIEKNVENKYNDKYFNSHFWMFKYEDEIRERIIDYKFNDRGYLFRFFAEVIMDNSKANEYIKKFDYIIPVPLHKKRFKKRGYNQSELIAKALSKSMSNVQFCKNVLIKAKSIKPQSTLNKEERLLNIIDAFEINSKFDKAKFSDKRILIFDDIYTTGSTVNECARILIEANCKEIGIFTIAKD